MAKVGLWLRGARGKFAGAVLAKGAQGQTIQRELVKPSNPKTEGQATQRMKMAAVNNFYRGLSEILDHSFEGVKYGNTSRMHFMKLALSNPSAVASVEKGSKEFKALPLQISQGSLVNGLYANPMDAGSMSVKAISGKSLEDLGNNRAEGISAIKEWCGMSEGQLTFVVVKKASANSDAQLVLVKRIVLNESESIIDDFDFIKTIFTVGMGMLITPAVALGVIYSKEIEGKWYRSSENLVVDTLYARDFFNIERIKEVKKSYMKDTAITASARYLNEGNTNPVKEIRNIYVDDKRREIGPTITLSQGSHTLRIAANNGFDADLIYAEENARIHIEGERMIGDNFGAEIEIEADATAQDTFVLHYGEQVLLTVKKG